MKGKQLFYDDLMKLSIGTKVWVEYHGTEKYSYQPKDSVETIGVYYGTNILRDVGGLWDYIDKDNSMWNTKYYEWIEEEKKEYEPIQYNLLEITDMIDKNTKVTLIHPLLKYHIKHSDVYSNSTFSDIMSKITCRLDGDVLINVIRDGYWIRHND